MRKLYAFMRNNLLSRDKLNYERGVAKNIHYGDIHTKFQALFDITRESVPFINESESVPGADSEDYCVEGDLIFADASEDMRDVGKCIEVIRLAGERLLSGQHTILARPKDDALVIGFGGHLFRSGLMRSRIEKEAQGTKVYQISSSRLGGIDITYPSGKGEQQKIADCLTSLDEVIAAQVRKVEALKAHKRGLMQQLFPREGETRPRLRFPEFRNAPEWEQHRLGDIASVSKGKGISKADIAVEGRTPCIRYGELYTVYGEVIDRPVSRTDVPTVELVLSQAGDVLVPASGETKEDIATSAVVLGAGVALGGDLNIIRLDADGRFFSYYLNGAKRRALAKVAQGDTVVHLYPRQLEQLDVAIPVNRAEQQRIADCLSSLDTQITAETNQLAALKTHKQGLMQQLFPAPEAAGA